MIRSERVITYSGTIFGIIIIITISYLFVRKEIITDAQFGMVLGRFN